MRPDLRVVSAALEQKEFEDLERIRADVGMSRSDIIREAIRQFIAIHDFKRYIDHLRPDQISDITHSERIFKTSPYKMTCKNPADDPGYNQKGSNPLKKEADP